MSLIYLYLVCFLFWIAVVVLFECLYFLYKSIRQFKHDIYYNAKLGKEIDEHRRRTIEILQQHAIDEDNKRKEIDNHANS